MQATAVNQINEINFVTNNKGERTGILIPLLHPVPQKEKIELTSLQIDVLKLFAKNVSESQMQELRTIIAKYFLAQARKSAGKAWNEKNYTTETFEELVNEKS